MFIEAKDDGSGGDSWSYRSCKAPVKSLPPTNQHQVKGYWHQRADERHGKPP